MLAALIAGRIQLLADFGSRASESSACLECFRLPIRWDRSRVGMQPPFVASCCTAGPNCSRGDWESPEQGLKASGFRLIDQNSKPDRTIRKTAPVAIPIARTSSTPKGKCEGKRLIICIKRVRFVMERVILAIVLQGISTWARFATPEVLLLRSTIPRRICSIRTPQLFFLSLGDRQ